MSWPTDGGLMPPPSRRAALPRFTHQVEVGWVELRHLLEALPVEDLDHTSDPRHQPLGPKFLESAVHMDGRKPEHVPHALLRERKAEAMPLCLSNRLQPQEQLAEEVSEAGVG